MPRPLVIDASVAAKWFLAEPDSEQALKLARLAATRSVTLHAPDIWVAECANAIWKTAVKLRRIDPQAARAAVAWLKRAPVRDAASRPLLPRAYAIASEAGITVYDALYLTLAEALDTQVVTADGALVRRLAKTPWGSRVQGL